MLRGVPAPDPAMKWRTRESAHSAMVSQVPWRTIQLLDVQILTVSARTAPNSTAPTASVASTQK